MGGRIVSGRLFLFVERVKLLRSMQKTLTYATMAVAMLVPLMLHAAGTVPAAKKAPPTKAGTRRAVSKKRAPGGTKKPAASAARKPATAKSPATAARRGGKQAPGRHATTWRNRQMAPTPERYREIQAALVAKGYLKSEDAGGPWNQASMDALKNFQAGQNLDSTGKINSLSLIALGLGPKREAPPPVGKPPVEKPPGAEQSPEQHW